MRRTLHIALLLSLTLAVGGWSMEWPGVSTVQDSLETDSVEVVADSLTADSSSEGSSDSIIPDSTVSAGIVVDSVAAIPVVDSVATTQAKSQKPQVLESLGQASPTVSWSLSVAKIFWAIVVFVLGYVLIRWVTRLLEAIAERRPRARLTIKAVVPVIRIFGWTSILFFIIARVFAPPMETLIAFTASAGIAIGFASQDILKNIFGGIIILFDRPFQVGDKIQVGSHYGEVVHIGLRTVRIVTADDSLVSIPNGEVVNQAVSNSNSGESNCQVVAEFYLPSGVDLGQVKMLARRAALVSRYTYLKKPIAVVMKNEIHEGRSMIKVRLKAYVLDIRYEFAFMSDLTQILLEELLRRELVKREDLDFAR